MDGDGTEIRRRQPHVTSQFDTARRASISDCIRFIGRHQRRAAHDLHISANLDHIPGLTK
jgi:hypothetical protein